VGGFMAINTNFYDVEKY